MKLKSHKTEFYVYYCRLKFSISVTFDRRKVYFLFLVTQSSTFKGNEYTILCYFPFFFLYMCSANKLYTLLIIFIIRALMRRVQKCC